MKKLLLASVLVVPLIFGGVAFADYNHKVTVCYQGENKEVKKRFLGYWLQKGATEGECPVDVCPNIPETQATVPEGYELKNEECTEIPEEPPIQPEKPSVGKPESIGNKVKPNPIVPISAQVGK